MASMYFGGVVHHQPSAVSSRVNESVPIVQVIPRKKRGGDDKLNDEVTLTMEFVSTFFHMRQSEVAKHLGISLTALKSACRRIGLPRWPYSRKRCAQGKKGKAQRETSDDAMAEHSSASEDDSDSNHEQVPPNRYYFAIGSASLFQEALEHLENGFYS
eukprot:764836-Hanusia_phi.AAC.4